MRIPNNVIYDCCANKMDNLFSCNNETWLLEACDLNKTLFTKNIPLIQTLITDTLYEFFSIRDME